MGEDTWKNPGIFLSGFFNLKLSFERIMEKENKANNKSETVTVISENENRTDNDKVGQSDVQGVEENCKKGDFSAKDGTSCCGEAVKKPKTRGGRAASYIAKTAMFTALAFILHVAIRVPLPFAFAPWLELHVSDIPSLIGGFALGPAAGCIITSLRVLLKVAVQGTTSAFVGDIGDLIIGISFVLPASFVYKSHKSKKSALIGIIAGSLCSVAAAMLVNRFLLIPFYAQTMGFPALVSSLKALFPAVTEENFYGYYIFLSVLPFNVLRCSLCGGITFFLYKHISKLLKMF